MWVERGLIQTIDVRNGIVYDCQHQSGRPFGARGPESDSGMGAIESFGLPALVRTAVSPEQNNPGYDDCSALRSSKVQELRYNRPPKPIQRLLDLLNGSGTYLRVLCKATDECYVRRLTKPRATGGHFVGRSRSPSGGRSRRRGHSTKIDRTPGPGAVVHINFDRIRHVPPIAQHVC